MPFLSTTTAHASIAALQAQRRILGRAGNATRTLAEIATGIPGAVGHGHLSELIYGRPSQLP